uniref:Uncharacterized protein n=1 Tax=Heterorhabditis bacteriophora TaxID=37862 RepID=A0A1I7WSA9_HETBA
MRGYTRIKSAEELDNGRFAEMLQEGTGQPQLQEKDSCGEDIFCEIAKRTRRWKYSITQNFKFRNKNFIFQQNKIEARLIQSSSKIYQKV